MSIPVAVWLRYPLMPFPDEALLARVRGALPDAELIVCDDEAAFRAALPRAQVAATWAFDKAWLASAPSLRWIATPSAGHEWMLGEPYEGVAVTYGGFHGKAMSETAVGCMLAFTRGIFESLRRMPSEAWPRDEVAATMRPVAGRRAVILGFGRIGKWVGRRLKTFGMAVTGVNRANLERPDYFTDGDHVVTMAGLDDAMKTAEHLFVVLPGTTGTDRLVDARRLALLPRGAYVYNIGRGNAIDETALAAALDGGHLAGAALDVFAHEPLAEDSPLRRCRNAILMPHTSGFGPDYLPAFFDEFIEHWRQRFGGA